MVVMFRMYSKIPDVTWKQVEEMIVEEFPSVTYSTTSELARLIDSDQSPVIIDCRAEAEYAVSHLPGAKRAATVAEVEKIAASDSEVVVYCSVGYRSARLVSELERAGFTKARNLDGSIFAWANEGRDLVTADGKSATTAHPFNKRWGKLLREELRHR